MAQTKIHRKIIFGHGQSGFTLVEILIAVFIFGLAFTAITFILTTNSRSATSIKNNFIASGLAQEGIEVVRNIRDRDWFLGNSFGTSIPDGTYRVQWDSQALLTLDSNPNLKSDPATGLFSYDSGGDTLFKRTIDVVTEVTGVEKSIVVDVTWTERGSAPKSVSAEDHLFNWK
ncbi:MAG: type II secretion system protein [Candidatus Yanofskybacteria bacterium]|nr:type II secretion system protein [Candidatus Yanofskybacteria bacterium]